MLTCCLASYIATLPTRGQTPGLVLKVLDMPITFGLLPLTLVHHMVTPSLASYTLSAGRCLGGGEGLVR